LVKHLTGDVAAVATAPVVESWWLGCDAASDQYCLPTTDCSAYSGGHFDTSSSGSPTSVCTSASDDCVCEATDEIPCKGHCKPYCSDPPSGKIDDEDDQTHCLTTQEAGDRTGCTDTLIESCECAGNKNSYSGDCTLKVDCNDVTTDDIHCFTEAAAEFRTDCTKDADQVLTCTCDTGDEFIYNGVCGSM
jgi:hypothetical protein